jgi:hypothetical protein
MADKYNIIGYSKSGSQELELFNIKHQYNNKYNINSYAESLDKRKINNLLMKSTDGISQSTELHNNYTFANNISINPETSTIYVEYTPNSMQQLTINKTPRSSRSQQPVATQSGGGIEMIDHDNDTFIDNVLKEYVNFDGADAFFNADDIIEQYGKDTTYNNDSWKEFYQHYFHIPGGRPDGSGVTKADDNKSRKLMLMLRGYDGHFDHAIKEIKNEKFNIELFKLLVNHYLMGKHVYPTNPPDATALTELENALCKGCVNLGKAIFNQDNSPPPIKADELTDADKKYINAYNFKSNCIHYLIAICLKIKTKQTRDTYATDTFLQTFKAAAAPAAAPAAPAAAAPAAAPAAPAAPAAAAPAAAPAAPAAAAINHINSNTLSIDNLYNIDQDAINALFTNP